MKQWQSAREPADAAVGEMARRIVAAAEELEAGLVERSVEARVLLLAAFCGEHLLLLGPPGTAKSLLARRLSRFLGDDAIFFERLLTRFSVPEELFGPLSLKGLEQDEYVRKTSGYLPEASIAFVDEIFKANSAILNSLLSIVNERIFDNGPDRVKVPLRCLVAASNEAPESEELGALYDRLLFRLVVKPVSDEGVGALVAAAARGPGADGAEGAEGRLGLGMADAERAAAGAETVAVPSHVVEVLREARRFLQDVSDRRLGQAVRMLQVVAWSCGRHEVELCDCWLLQHVLWSSPDMAETFRKWLLRRLTRSSQQPLANLLSGLLARVGRAEQQQLAEELHNLRKALEDEVAVLERQLLLVRDHPWLPKQEQRQLAAALEADLAAPNSPRTLLLEVARLSAAAELDMAELETYVRDRQKQGELLWSKVETRTGEDETFKLGKHKGRLFSDVARDDVDYCRMVRRKLKEGGFAGDAPLDRQVRAFVAYLQQHPQ